MAEWTTVASLCIDLTSYQMFAKIKEGKNSPYEAGLNQFRGKKEGDTLMLQTRYHPLFIQKTANELEC